MSTGSSGRFCRGGARTLRAPGLRSVMVEMSLTHDAERSQAIQWLRERGFTLASTGAPQGSGGEQAANHLFVRRDDGGVRLPGVRIAERARWPDGLSISRASRTPSRTATSVAAASPRTIRRFTIDCTRGRRSRITTTIASWLSAAATWFRAGTPQACERNCSSVRRSIDSSSSTYRGSRSRRGYSRVGCARGHLTSYFVLMGRPILGVDVSS